jgi:hypothetical protein
MHKITLEHSKLEQLPEAILWCKRNIGPGQQRFNANTWLGTDDWFCFEEINDLPEDEHLINDDFDSEDYGIVFVFRRESDMTLFSLKWA